MFRFPGALKKVGERPAFTDGRSSTPILFLGWLAVGLPPRAFKGGGFLPPLVFGHTIEGCTCTAAHTVREPLLHSPRRRDPPSGCYGSGSSFAIPALATRGVVTQARPAFPPNLVYPTTPPAGPKKTRTKKRKTNTKQTNQ